MKVKFFFIFTFVLHSLIAFNQNYKDKISRTDFVNHTEFGDTIIDIEYFSNGEIKKIEVMYESTSKYGNYFLPYIKVEKYNKKGVLKREIFYDKGLVLKDFFYDRKGRNSIQYFYHNKNPNEILLDYKKGTTHPEDYDYYMYYKGKLILKKTYQNGKRDGITEVYDDSGRVKKIKVFKKGRKISKKIIPSDDK